MRANIVFNPRRNWNNWVKRFVARTTEGTDFEPTFYETHYDQGFSIPGFPIDETPVVAIGGDGMQNNVLHHLSKLHGGMNQLPPFFPLVMMGGGLGARRSIEQITGHYYEASHSLEKFARGEI